MDTIERSPENYIQAMNEALGQGGLHIATKISIEAIEHYPDHQEIQKYARILAPPKTTFHKLPPDLYARIHQDWVMQHRFDYRGRWVALREGKLIADAASADELIDRVGEENMKSVFFTVVY
ncbi:hypothetical protein [Aerosakkonema funiforme]|uniref:DUF5678 domain-containing protein n=1 Tax=Aerosakkonema funiforme FACHB-1375 TaxID=2949571 RepID=A0A926VHI8_9CYAN|nr:hypothetical protein [Aerosakkonema funiforme]MBD2182744.1 hypothetical protein [Aerosakkonema funiforme FACHB-1375]